MNRNSEIEAIALKEYLDTHYTEKYDINNLSRVIFKCPSQAIRIFKKHYRMTPYAYYTNLRLEKASLLLKTTDMPIKDISLKLGFADEHYFSAAFKQQTGFNPSEFRKR